ncbi:hypothetical protein DSM106972_043250 [Dulcicalothrix desertica PCC 7102]|uniref:Fido domain-containing protein n=1 Tax=Dulcicalothrix desertica PCC 7102 TaxID=232991 RepID=A0A3S1D771_9CYAN|nr:Fic family protein [Dulcicalothrix desertica]RUT04756.1 hypothetical protein DSM106972_043250 [Dulcicalothrix desertica PCC 7102]TWH42767.1 Fic family protein [Dulcicalothrix desertica PCC 7102]
MVQATYVWKPIENLPEDWTEFASTELESLAEIWKAQASKLQKSNALNNFNEKLSREWAIETGIIENIYYIDEPTTQLLIEKGINVDLMPFGTTDKLALEIVPLLNAHQEALEALFNLVQQKRSLSIFFIRELHQIITQHQETVDSVDAFGRKVQVTLLQGQWKKHSNNPTRKDGAYHQYCPPLQVQTEMERLINMHLEHIKEQVTPEIEAAWLHHRFTQIHPFQDGNGRVARALASLVFIQAGCFPLVITRNVKDEYIDALEAADRGNLSNLVHLFTKLQKKLFTKVLSLSENNVIENEVVQQAIIAGITRIKARKEKTITLTQSQLFELAHKLENIAEQKFGLVALELNHNLKQLEEIYFADAEKSNETNNYWFRQQVIQTASSLEYYADTRTYCSWVRLKIKEDRQTEIIISFHALGFEFFGLLAASAFIQYRDISEGQEILVVSPHVLCNEVFQFSHIEQEDSVIQRFNVWLEDVLLVGIDQWRKQL